MTTIHMRAWTPSSMIVLGPIQEGAAAIPPVCCDEPLNQHVGGRVMSSVLVEDEIGMSATDAARFVEFAVSDAQRIETERMTTRLDMLCTPADSETSFQRLHALAELGENWAQESMILSRSLISREAAVALQRYLDVRKLSTAYMRTDYRKAFEVLRIDVLNHVAEECAAGGRQ